MHLYKSVLLFIVLLLTACRRERPTTVWLCDDYEVTLLKGNVKQVLISYNSQPTDFFYRVYFDEEGNLTHSEQRALDIAQMEHQTDSTIITENIKYSLQSDYSGNKVAVVGSISGDLSNKSQSEDKYTNRSKWEFDRSDHAIDYIPAIDAASDTGRYRYNAAGDLVEYKRNYQNLADRDLYKYKYDYNHRIIECDFFDSGWLLSTTSFRYKSFDSHKNWTVRISFQKNLGPGGGVAPNTDTVIRKITYY
jgi:hypothetical protein